MVSSSQNGTSEGSPLKELEKGLQQRLNKESSYSPEPKEEGIFTEVPLYKEDSSPHTSVQVGEVGFKGKHDPFGNKEDAKLYKTMSWW